MEPTPRATQADLALVERLRAGDEAAFMDLVDRLTPSMRRVARMYVTTDAVADEVVQDAWVGVLQGLHRFEGRSSLRTWIFRILVNIAKKRGQREGRSVPFASLAGDDLDQPSFDPATVPGPRATRGRALVDASRSTGAAIPEDRLVARELLARDRPRRSTALPPMQAEVLRLRDVAGWSTEEIRNALDLTDTNQRVLLHRARAKVRAALEEYLRSVSRGMSDELTCREVVELLSDYLDGALDPATRAHVEAHLAGCDGCTIVLDQLRETIRRPGRLDRGPRHPRTSARPLRAAFRALARSRAG